MAAIGASRMMEASFGIAWGKAFPEFWVTRPHDGAAASAGNGTHVSFLAVNSAGVGAFHAAELVHGGTDEGTPGLRPHYHAGYYAGYVRDPDDNKIEAMTLNG